jgi:cardiolipin synthase
MPLNWIPNAISILRIALVVPILLLIQSAEYGWALLLFWIAGFSDGIDGYLATRFDWQTRLGALLDPIADKLLVAGLFIMLSVSGLIPVWLTATVLFRDIVIIGGAVAYNYLVQPVQGEPTRISKLNTVLQLLFLLFVLSRAAFDWPDEISITVLGAATFVTIVISGIDYVVQWSRRARKETSE